QLIRLARLWTEAVISMDDMFTQLKSRFALTEEEKLEVVVYARETLAVKTTRFLLIGKLMAAKPYNKEALKRTMANLWKPKPELPSWTSDMIVSPLLSLRRMNAQRSCRAVRSSLMASSWPLPKRMGPQTPT
ncbi:PREDICTED: 2-alkenal reductase, partial [Prunus dulcis]